MNQRRLYYLTETNFEKINKRRIPQQNIADKNASTYK